MSTWESSEQTNLVADGDTHVLECYGDWPTGLSDEVGLAGWTAGASNFITIKAASGHEHGGVSIDDGGSGFMMYGTTNPTINLAVPYTVIQDIELQRVGNSTLQYGTTVSDGVNSLLQRLIIRNTAYSTASTTGAIRTPSNCVLRNCSILLGGRAVDVRNPTGVSILNCTVVADDAASAYGILLDSDITIKNTAVYGFATEDVFGVPGTEANCATGDGSLTGTGAVSGLTTSDFNDYANDDLSPASGGVLVGAGADLSGLFTDDITGATRTTWDIGAYAYIASGLSVNDIIAMRRKPNTPLIAM